MPEMTLTVQWPDGRRQEVYSPSLVLHDHLETGRRYAVADFTRRTLTALGEASDRVRAAYGFACTSAAASAESVEAAAARYDGADPVEVLAMRPPLPSSPVDAAAPAGATGAAEADR